MNRTVDVFSNVDVDKLENEIKEDMKNLSDKSDTDNNTSTNKNIGNFQVDLVGSLNKNNKHNNNFHIDLVADLRKKESKEVFEKTLTRLFSKNKNWSDYGETAAKPTKNKLVKV